MPSWAFHFRVNLRIIGMYGPMTFWNWEGLQSVRGYCLQVPRTSWITVAIEYTCKIEIRIFQLTRSLLKRNNWERLSTYNPPLSHQQQRFSFSRSTVSVFTRQDPGKCILTYLQNSCDGRGSSKPALSVCVLWNFPVLLGGFIFTLLMVLLTKENTCSWRSEVGPTSLNPSWTTTWIILPTTSNTQAILLITNK